MQIIGHFFFGVVIYLVVFGIGYIVVACLSDAPKFKNKPELLKTLRAINVTPIVNIILVLLGAAAFIAFIAVSIKKYINGENEQNDDW